VVDVAVAKVFQSGNSQAIRLPKEFRFAGKEVEISRRGDEIVLREPQGGLLRALDILAQLPDDFLEDLEDPPPQQRKGL
jgi:antitoxin VapB